MTGTKVTNNTDLKSSSYFVLYSFLQFCIVCLVSVLCKYNQASFHCEVQLFCGCCCSSHENQIQTNCRAETALLLSCV